MAITDALLTVSDAQVVTASAVSTNTVDLQQNRDIGGGERLFMLFTVIETAASGGASTVTFDAVTSAAAGLTSPTVIGSSGAIPKAQITAGKQFAVALNPVTGLGQRYLGANYTVGTANLTAGKFTASIVRDVPTNVGKYYPSGYTVS